MVKVYSFQYQGIASIFFEDGETTWWPLSLLVKIFSFSGSSSILIKKWQLSAEEQKRFSQFQNTLVNLPKTSYFISKPGIERILETEFFQNFCLECQEFKDFLSNPFENGTVQEVVQKNGAGLTKNRKKTSGSIRSSANLSEVQLTELIFELLVFTKELTIALQMKQSLTVETKRAALLVLKNLNARSSSDKKK